jgi:MFS family permease
MDSSIVAASLLNIGTEFQEMDNVNWVALSYTLCYLSFAVFVSRLSDIIGRRNAFAGAYLIFFAFSLGCGFAQNMTQLIACRAFQGIGGSGECPHCTGFASKTKKSRVVFIDHGHTH